MQRIEIDKNKVLSPGDVIELEFTAPSGLWLQSAEIAAIEYKLSGRKDWEIISNSLPADGRVRFTVLVKDSKQQDPGLQTASIGVTALMIAAAIVSVTLVTYFTFVSAYKLVEDSPAGPVAMSGVGAAGWALLIYVIYKYVLGN